MTGGETAGITIGAVGAILAIIGIIVALVVYRRTDRILKGMDNILKRIDAILIARMSPSEYKQALRLIDDIQKTGEKRGTIAQRANGVWGIDWDLAVNDKVKVGDKPR